MRTIDEIQAAMTALIDGAAGRSLTDEEVTAYGDLETELAATRRSDDIRARNAAYNSVAPGQPGPAPAVPTAQVTAEPLPYRASRVLNAITQDMEWQFSTTQEHDLTSDLAAMARAGDQDGTRTPAGERVMRMLQHAFRNDVDTADVPALNPTIQRPDMWVDQRDYRTPLSDLIGRGAPPNGVQPFRFPKFSSAAGLVGDHTEGTEPTSGTYVVTDQTVTPTALSGKAVLTRETWDMGGNPAIATLVFNQMTRGYREGLESSAATFLNTLTAAADIALAAGIADEVLAAAIDAAMADLQFVRGYDFRAFVLEKELFKKFVAARDDTGRVLYPILSPSNANGTAASRFRTLDIAGTTGIPSWALASTAGSPNNSWLFDPSCVHGWWTAPQRLEFPGHTQAGAYAPVAFVGIGIWGYKAFACTDIAGVRQVTYDTTA